MIKKILVSLYFLSALLMITACADSNLEELDQLQRTNSQEVPLTDKSQPESDNPPPTE